MTTIEFSMPGSGREPVSISSEKLSELAGQRVERRDRVEFTVYGGEFVRMLQVVQLFQADPKKFDVLAAVRCISSGDGLYMAAVNGASAAAVQVDTIDTNGLGLFSISHDHVKQICSFFKPSSKQKPDEFVLKVSIAGEELVIADVSKLFGGDKLVMALPPDGGVFDHGDQSESDRVIAAFSSLAGGTAPDHPIDLADGIHFSSAEIARIGRAAGLYGHEVSFRMAGRRLVSPIGERFIAYTAGTLRKDDKESRPYLDERALSGWRDRLQDLEKGAL